MSTLQEALGDAKEAGRKRFLEEAMKEFRNDLHDFRRQDNEGADHLIKRTHQTVERALIGYSWFLRRMDRADQEDEE